MPTISTSDQTTLYVKDWGAGAGRPVVLLSGWPLTADSWDDQAGILQSTLIEYDGAPHGLFATHKHRLSEDLLSFVRR